VIWYVNLEEQHKSMASGISLTKKIPRWHYIFECEHLALGVTPDLFIQMIHIFFVSENRIVGVKYQLVIGTLAVILIWALM
jgi:hypothetical protein